METFLTLFFISFIVFVLFFVLMGIGFLLQKKPLKGSCGGVAAMMGDEFCQFCGNDPNQCDGQSNNKSPANSQALAKQP